MGTTNAAAMPQTIEDCAQAIAAYGKVERKIKGLQSLQDHQVAEITASIEKQAAPLREERDRIFNSIQAFCETRRKELCKGKAKSHKFTTGVAGWRSGKVVAYFDKAKERLILNQLIAAGLKQCYETVTKIKKGEIVKTPASDLKKIEGITVKPAPETFYIKPHDVPVDQTGEAA